ncbi:YnfC family lipoprotein [Providencia alcalifaciens]|uniref:YnfC family lipoprotein n=1 Tax=Providencia alcalifaciens TaxID=126385 RepID=UPI0015D0C8EA|nr:YnfC family lipoprotein [Providencia alcalifaciens]MBF0690291.1 YnfC family lipoprotein [Providencia alcalifaciens]NYS88795.1 YnfC family lipoprotein [Providencia alcalifaciens]
MTPTKLHGLMFFFMSPLALAQVDNELLNYDKRMVNYSTEFQFDPLYGKVKELTQTMNDDKGLRKRVSVSFNPHGCLNELTYYNKDSETEFTIVRKSKQLYFLIDKQKLKGYRIDKMCNLQTGELLNWKYYYRNGLVNKITQGDKDIATFVYGSELLPIETHYFNENEVTNTKNEYFFTDGLVTKILFHATKNQQPYYEIVQKCTHYDDHKNPTSCTSVMTYSDGRVDKFTYDYKTTYYE